MNRHLNVLILEDHPEDAELVVHELRRAEFKLDWKRVETEQDYVASLHADLDLILADYNLPQFDGLRALIRLQESGLNIPFIVVTGGYEELAIACMKLGADDYLIKDRMGRLGEAVRQALQAGELREQKRQADMALVESEARYRTLFEDARDAIMITTRQGEIVDFNYAALMLFGYSRDEMLVLNSAELYADPKDRQIFQTAIEKAGAVRNFEVRLRARTGLEMVCLLTASLRHGPDGETLGYQSIIRDITEQKSAQKALRESETRFRSVAETAVDAIVLVDNNREILYWNPAAETIFGYPPQEALGNQLAVLFSRQGKTGAIVQIEKLLESIADQPGRVFEVVGRRKGGEEFPLELSLTAWEASGSRFYSATIRDLSKAKEALQLAQSQDRLAAVGQLAAGIAHDFNNILGTIMLYAELLLKRGELPPEDREELGTIFKQAQRGAALTSQILDFGRKSVMAFQPVDLISFLKEMVDLLSRTLPESVRLRIEPESGRFVVNADTTRLQQAIMNLALNARDAMPQGGELDFELGVAEYGPTDAPPYPGMPPGEWVWLRVSDTGGGIPEAALAHIFEPFFTTKAPGEGTGLGLAQVYGIVRLHGGYIDVTSHPGRGTSFVLYLPETREPVAPSSAHDIPETAIGGGETILVVEDDAATREAVGKILVSLQYQPLFASTGEEALHIYTQHPGEIDLVLSDLVMPVLGGKALYEALLQVDPQAKVVLMTGYPLGKGTRQLIEERRVVWLQKPFSTDTVGRTLRRVLKRRGPSHE